MDVRRQVAGLRSWLPLLIASAVLAGGLAYLASGLLPKVYEAKSTLLIGQSLSAVNPDFAQLQASQQLSNTYVKLATTRQIMVAVIDKLGLKDTPQSLERRVQAATPINSTLLDITVTDPDADAAAAIANEIAAQVIKASPDLQGQEEQIRQFVAADLAATQTQIETTQTEVNRLAGLPTRTAAEDAQLNLLESRLTSLRASYAGLLSFASNDASNLVSLFDPAVALKDPVSPRPLVNTLLAAVLGLLLVMAIIVIATYFDDSVKTTEDVEEATGLPTLGAIPRMPGGRGRSEIYQLATLLYPRSAAAEAYRTVRTNLEFASVDEPIQSLLVTSAGPGEGKSVTAANLAIAFAQAGRKVLLIDADLRKPGVHALFNLGNDRGLTNLLRGDDTRWESVVQPTEQEGLRVLTTGVQPPNPAELLGSQRMKRVLEKLAAAHELLIIDSPPLLIVTDAAILSSVANGTVLVIDAKRTRRDSARNAREALTKSGATVLGALLNGLPPKDFPAYGGYYGTETSGRSRTSGAESSQPS